MLFRSPRDRTAGDFLDDLNGGNFLECYGAVLSETSTLFCMGFDTQPCALVIENRFDSDCHGDAAAFNRICR